MKTRPLPKGFYPTITALLFSFSTMCVLYIHDRNTEYLTVDVLKEQATEQGKYIKQLIMGYR